MRAILTRREQWFFYLLSWEKWKLKGAKNYVGLQLQLSEQCGQKIEKTKLHKLGKGILSRFANYNIEIRTESAWKQTMPEKKPRLRKVLLLCAIWGKVCTLLTFSASWDEWYLSQTTLLNRTLKRTKMPALSWYRTLSASFLICTYSVPHSQGGSTKLMENVSAIVIKRLLITWAIFTTITCVRVKKRWHKNKNHWFCRSNDKTILMNIEWIWRSSLGKHLTSWMCPK